MLPLVSLFFYRNAFPYFYAYILPPAMVAAAIAAGPLSRRYPAPLLCSLFLLNAAIVKRYGMRLIGHGALILFTFIAGIHALVAWSGHETLESFIILQMVMMMAFPLMGGNFNAMAMERMGRVAGTASSVQGFTNNLVSAIIGTIIGRAFDGTTVPLYLAYFVCGMLALIIVFVTEGGRLFVARNASVPAE